MNKIGGNMNIKEEVIQQKLNRSFRHFKRNIAIECGTRSLTYEELKEKAVHLAGCLRDNGVEKEAFVGILAAGRVELIIAIIGILENGSVFVPLDPQYPDDRLTVMIDTTDIRFIICDSINFSRLAANKMLESQNVRLIPLPDLLDPPTDDQTTGSLSSVEEGNNRLLPLPEVHYSPGDKIYIYFTSGTTGKPKAIVGKNKSLLHFINWEIETFGIDETYRFSQFTPPGFDVYLRDIFTPLCAGAAVCIPGNEEILFPSEELIKWINKSRINLIHCVPSLFRLINTPGLKSEDFPALKYVLFAGEKVIPRELENWYDTFGQRIQLVNLYGPTETTLAKVFYLIRPADTQRQIMPIGKHIKGARIIILNESREICPESVTGEIYIRTPYATYGYYNDFRLNQEKFIPNPFNKDADPGDLLYRTGDLGRFLPDGNIELRGRIDRQVKIRGIRIELDEVENTMVKHPEVKEAVVIRRQLSDKNEYLAALITCFEEDKEKDEDTEKNAHERTEIISRVKTYLREKLPGNMIPVEIIITANIPRKLNGKVDYEDVTAIINKSHKDFTAPRDPIENKLQQIWTDLLGIKRIGMRSTFFELGGNSLSVMTLISRIHKEYDVRVSLGDIFKNPTIDKQATLIRKTAGETFTAIQPVEKKEYYDLSPAQQRLYLLQRMNPRQTAYNLPEIYILEGNSGALRETFEHIFSRLVNRHESLRTAFPVVGDHPVQHIYDHHQVSVEIEYDDLVSDEENSILHIISKKDFIRPFDLSRAPLLRVRLNKIQPTGYLLMVDLHHIISDAVSHQVLTEEFSRLYRGHDLPRLRIHYKDFSQWQRNNKQNPSHTIKKQENYWLKLFSGDIPILNLPGDFTPPPGEWFACHHVNFELDGHLVARLADLRAETGITLYMALLAGFFILLSRYTRQEDLVIGSPISGRDHPDLEHIIGMFVNMLALRNKPESQKTLGEFLEEIKENTWKAFENSDFQFDDLIGKLGIDRDTRGNPLSEVVFNMVNRVRDDHIDFDSDADNPLTFSPYPLQVDTIPFHLLLNALETSKGVDLSLSYSTALFKNTTIEKMARHYIEILDAMTETGTKEARLGDIKISHELLEVKPTNLRDTRESFHF